jgi:hypothetical protein
MLFSLLCIRTELGPQEQQHVHIASEAFWRGSAASLHGMQMPVNSTQRSPHPLHGDANELQTFECPKCERSAGRGDLPRTSKTARKPRPPPCTMCGALVILARIERANPGFDLHTFECSKCNNADQYLVEYGTLAPWLLRVRVTG